MAFQLRLIQDDIRRDPAGAEARVTNASQEVARSLQELRELARGIHPAVLEQGLAPALTSLAARSAVPTAVSCEPGAVPSAVELALYFVACEALANVAKYAQATAASCGSRGPSGVAIEIADDGVGGARATRDRACAACRTASRRWPGTSWSRVRRRGNGRHARRSPCAS